MCPYPHFPHFPDRYKTPKEGPFSVEVPGIVGMNPPPAGTLRLRPRVQETFTLTRDGWRRGGTTSCDDSSARSGWERLGVTEVDV